MGKIAMTYGHVYVASVAMGANKNQLMKGLSGGGCAPRALFDPLLCPLYQPGYP